jgi:Ran GTPase-activating protein (RanGAP) involved in mRNA processing and transport
VASGLAVSTTLTDLDLSNNSGTQATFQISNALRANSTLTVLNLADNFLKAEGAAHIADALWLIVR